MFMNKIVKYFFIKYYINKIIKDNLHFIIIRLSYICKKIISNKNILIYHK